MKWKIAVMILVVVCSIAVVFGASTGGTTAPEASKFSQVSPSTPGYTGDVGLSIPVMTVPGRGGMDFPLTLSYSPGIRSDEESSWVGLGWNLGSGAITRSVVNIPDDYDACEDGAKNYVGSLHAGSLDYNDHDYFSISAPGVGGSLLFDSNNNWVVNGWKKIKIVPTYGASLYGNRIISWLVTLEDGTTLTFGQAAYTWVDTVSITGKKLKITEGVHGSDDIPITLQNKNKCAYAYAWYLTEIHSPDSYDDSHGNWIKLSYDNKHPSDSEFRFTYPRVSFYNSDADPNNNIAAGSPTYTISWGDFNGIVLRDIPNLGLYSYYAKNIVKIQKWYLNQVLTPTFRADFSTCENQKSCQNRPDLADDNAVVPPYLEKIQLTSLLGGSETLVSEALFTYAHEDDTTVSQELMKGSEPGGRGKLTLLSVKNKGYAPDGTSIELPATKFSYGYNPSFQFFAKDIWGYYNGKMNNDGFDWDWWTGAGLNECKACYVPGSYDLPELCLACGMKRISDLDDYSTPNTFVFQGTDGCPVSGGCPYASAWSLTSVKYPTGGSVSYEYDIDRFSWVSNKYEDNPMYYSADTRCRTHSTMPLLDKKPVNWYPHDGGNGAAVIKPARMDGPIYGGGLRVGKISVWDGIPSSVPITKVYTYGDGAAVKDFSVYNTLFSDMKSGASGSNYVGYASVTETVPGYGSSTTYYTSVIDVENENLRNFHSTFGANSCPGGWWGYFDSYSTSNEYKRGLVKRMDVLNNNGVVIQSSTPQYGFVEKQTYVDSSQDLDQTPNFGKLDDHVNLGCGATCPGAYFETSILVKQPSSTSMQDGMTSTSSTTYVDADYLSDPAKQTGQPRMTTVTGSDGTEKRSYVTYAWEQATTLPTPPNVYNSMITKNMYAYPFESMAGDGNTVFTGTPSGLKAYSRTEYVGLDSNARIYGNIQKMWDDKDNMGDIDVSGDPVVNELIPVSTIAAADFDDWGHPLIVTDAKLIQTKTFYGANNGDNTAACSQTADLKHAFPTCVIVDPTGFNQKSKVMYGMMGNVLKMWDANDKTSSYLYDPLWRLKTAYNPGDSVPGQAPADCAGVTDGWSVCYDYKYAIQEWGALSYSYPFTNVHLNSVTTTTRINKIGSSSLVATSSAYADGLGKPLVELAKKSLTENVLKTTEYNAATMQPEKQSEPFVQGQADPLTKSKVIYETSPLMRAKKSFPLSENPDTSTLYSSNDYVYNVNYDIPSGYSFSNNVYGASRVVDPSGVGASSVVDRYGRSVESVANNLVVNPSFDLGIEFWNTCYTAELSPCIESGANCLGGSGTCLRALSRTSLDLVNTRQFGDISLKPDTDYKLSFWGIYSNGVFPRVSLNFDNAIAMVAQPNCVISGLNLQGTAPLSTEWAQVSCVFNSRTNDHINFVAGWGTGAPNYYAFIDDIQITPNAGAMDYVRTKTTYNDVMGLSVDVTNPSGQVTSSRADNLGRVRVTKNPDFGYRRNLRYDVAGNVVVSGDGCSASLTITGTPSSYNCQRTIGYVYDSLNRLRCIKYGLSPAEVNDNPVGSWTGIFTTYAASCPSAQVKYYYDTYTGAPAGCTSSGETCTGGVLDCPKGRLVAVENTYNANSMFCYYYDSRGQIQKEKRYIDGFLVGDGIEYEYDNAGNLIQLDYPNSDYAVYTYNQLNQLENVYLNGNDAAHLLSTYAYGNDGLVESQSYKRVC